MSDKDQPSKSSDEAGQRNASNDNRVLEVELVKKRQKEDHTMSESSEVEVKKMKVSDSRHQRVSKLFSYSNSS